ncbi:hypothetical protein P4O66_014493, partial [Electrophorus voltai]
MYPRVSLEAGDTAQNSTESVYVKALLSMHVCACCLSMFVGASLYMETVGLTRERQALCFSPCLVRVSQMVAIEQQQEIGKIRSLVLNLGQYVNCLAMSPERRATLPVTPPVPERIKCLIATPETYGRGGPHRLTGKARIWDAILVTNISPLMNDYTSFVQELKTYCGWTSHRPTLWTIQEDKMEVERFFMELKTTFSTALVLQSLDPEMPFVVEVDASDVG